MKAAIVTDAITVVGMIAIGALMFAQVPGMADDIRDTLSKESVRAQAVEIANKLTLAGASPDDITVIHEMPSEVSYTVTVKDGYVTVENANDEAMAKTLSQLTFGPEVVNSISITKTGIGKVA